MKTKQLETQIPSIIHAQSHHPYGARWHTSGITLVEMLVIIAIVAILYLLLIPSFAVSKVKAIRTQCLNNVKQIALGTVSYAIENHDLLPTAPEGESHSPWDISWEAAEALGTIGLTRSSMYDPAFPQQNDDHLWNAASNQYRVIGYAMALSGNSSTVIASNQNDTLGTPANLPLGLPRSFYDSDKRVLVADAVISFPGETDPNLRATHKWTEIPGGLPKGSATPYGPWLGFRTAHLDKNAQFPLGGNTGYLDGHARWRLFDDLLPRTTGANSTPIFWW